MRQDTLFNNGWQFILSDTMPDSEAEWKDQILPHDWSTEYDLSSEAPTGGGGGYAMAGIGWYRRTFVIDSEILASGKQVSLLFEGSYMDTAVYLNGKLISRHGYGYTPFIVTLNKELLVGENTLLVKVDNSHQPNSRWYSGSGIFRNVRLVITEDVHIAPWGVRCCTNGIYPELNRAGLLIWTALSNDGQEPKIAGISYQLLDREGKRVTSAGITLSLDPGATADCEVRPELEDPHLWTTEDPYLYTLVTQVQVEGETVDELSTPIGIRTAVFDCDKGFLLNDLPVKIKGMCLHHDCGLTGAVGYREVWERRLKKLKDMGCNGIRCSHNPPDPVLLDLCDEMGFLVMDEIFDEWTLMKHKNFNYYTQSMSYGSGMFFDSHAEEDLVKMIRRDFNHPSVILWSIGNEIPEQSSIDGVRLVRFLQGICHREDCSRKVTCACDNIASGSTARTLREFENELDVVGYNYVGRWRGRAETFYDEDRALFPKRCICGSENPSVGGDRGVYSEEHAPGSYAAATLHHEALWRYTVSHDFVAGDFLWTGIDYLGECRWPRKGAACGALDTAGFEKDSYYYFRSIWNKKDTTLHLLPHWNWQGQEGRFKQVVCYTSCEEVELYINDRLVGRKGFVCPRFGAVNNWYERSGVHSTTNDLHLTWDVPYEPGELKAVGYQDGEPVATYTVRTTGEPAALTAAVWENEHPAGTISVGSVIQIDVAALDSENLFVPCADNMVHCEIEGPAHLIGLDNGSLSDLTLCRLPDRKFFSGRLFAVLYADAPGELRVTFSSRGLEPVCVRLSLS